MRGEPGTSCRIAYDHDGDCPVDGDFLRTETGTCYLIDEVRHSPTRQRAYLSCTRLEPDAVQEGQEGVWPLFWHPRGRRRS